MTVDLFPQYVAASAKLMETPAPKSFSFIESLPTATTEQTAEDQSEFVKGINRGIDNLQALGAGGVGLLGDALDMETLRDWGYEEYMEQIAEASQYSPEVASYKDIDSPTAFLSYMAGTLGELTPSILQAIMTGGVAGFAGKQLAKKAIGNRIKAGIASGLTRTEAAKQALREYGKTIAGKAVTKALPVAAIAVPTAAQEAGGMWAGDVETYGLGSVPGERLAQAAGLGAISGSLELFGIESAILRGNVLSRIFGRELAEDTQRRLARRMATTAIKSAAGEGTTEATQELLGAFHREGLNISEESLDGIMESFVAGALGGAVFGGVSGAVGQPTVSDIRDTQPFQNLASRLADEYDNEKITGDKATTYDEAVAEALRDASDAEAVITGKDKTVDTDYKIQENQIKNQVSMGHISPAEGGVELTRIGELRKEAQKSAIQDARKQQSKAKTRLDELEKQHRNFTGRKARSRVAWENTQVQHIDSARKILAQTLLNPNLTQAQEFQTRTDLAAFEKQVEPLVRRVKEVPDLNRAEVAQEVAMAVSQVAPVSQIERLSRDEKLRNVATRARNEQAVADYKARQQQRQLTRERILERRAEQEALQQAQQERYQAGLETTYLQEDAADYAAVQRERREAERASQRRELTRIPYRERSRLRKERRAARRLGKEVSEQTFTQPKAQFGGYAPFVDELATTTPMRVEATPALSGPPQTASTFEARTQPREKRRGPAAAAKRTILPKARKPAERVKTAKEQKAQPAKKKKTVKQVSLWLKTSLDRLPNLRGQVNVVRNSSDERIPEHLRSEMKNVKAAFVQSTGQIYLFADNISNKRDAVRALIHEGVAHYGLRAIFSVGQLKKFLSVVYESKKNTEEFRKLILEDPKYMDLDKLSQAEEYVARVAERQTLGYHLNKDEKSLLNKIKELIKKALKRISKSYIINNKEINDILSASVFNLAKQHGGKGYRKEWTSLKDIRDVRASSIGERLRKDIKEEEKSILKRATKIFNETFFESTDAQGNLRKETGLDRLGAGLQDSTRRVKVAQKHVVDQGGTISAKSDVYQHEELSQNQIKTDRRKVDEKFITGEDGLLNRVARSADKKDTASTAYDKVSLLAYAMHAPERNKQLGIRSSTLTPEKVTSILGKEQVAKRFEESDLEQIASFVARTLANTQGKMSEDSVRKVSEKFSLSPEKARNLLETAREGATYKGSGWTNKEAAEVISELDTPERRLAVDKLHEINEYRLQLMVDSGLIKAGLAKEWRDTYQMYVPLKDWDSLTSDVLPAHLLSEETRARQEEALEQKKSGRGARKGSAGVGSWKAADRALGRETTAADPIAATIAQVHDTIAMAHKNEVGKTLLNLVEENPQFTDLWVMEKDAPQNWKKYFNPKTGGIDIRRASSKFANMSDQVITVLVNGDPVRVLIKDAPMARALKGADVAVAHPFLRMLGRFTRFLAQTMTTWNPAFWPTNAIRDLLTAAANLHDVKLEHNVQGELKRNLLRDYMKSRRAVYDAVMGKDPKSEYGQWFKLYEKYGGFTEMYGIKDMEGIKKDLKKEVKLLGTKGTMGDTRRFARKMGTAVEAFSTSIENATRLIAFKNMAQIFIKEKGMAKEDAYKKAASVALNLTVNFTKRGNWTSYLSPLYLFFNAAMQSNARVIKTVARNRALLPGIIVGSMVWGMMMDQIGGEDEDGNSWYSLIPQYEKDTNFIIMFPGGDYLKIPLPYGFNSIWVAGQALGDAVSKTMTGEDSGEAFSNVIPRVFGSAFDNFVPMGAAEEGLGMFIPSFIRPLYQIKQNENYFGKPIYPEDSYRKRGEFPDSEKYWANVNPMLLEFSRALNEYSFGSKYKKGLIDVSPETLEHLLASYMGGLGQTINRTSNLITKGLSRPEAIEARDVPILRRFGGSVQTEYAIEEKYRKLRTKIDAARYTYEDAKEARGNIAQVRKDYRQELSMIGRIKSTEGKIRKLLRAEKALRKAYYDYKKISFAEYSERMERLKKAKERAYRSALKSAERRGL